MGTRTGTTDPTFVRLAAEVASHGPRVVVLTAPAGYDKGRFLREYAGHTAPLTVAYLPPDPTRADLARPVFDALAASDPHRAGRSAADRLAQRAESAFADSRELLRREWASLDARQLFGVRDVFGAIATPAGADLLAELVGTLPAERSLVLSTRIPLAPALQQIIDVAGARTIGAADLALTADMTDALARAAGLSASRSHHIASVAGGWPLVTRLLVHLLAQGERLGGVLEASGALTKPALLAYLAHRTIARLDDAVRDTLMVVALLRESSHAQLMRILGDACDDLVFARLSALPFVVRSGERAVVHPEIAAMLPERFAPLATALYERTLNALTGQAAYVDAAQVALRRGDVTRAAAIIDAAPPYTAVPVPLAEYERIIDRLDRTLVTRYPNLWIATIPYRSFAVDRATFVREAETVYYCLPAGAGADQRAVALMLLASALSNAGRRGEADRLLDEALRGFARDAPRARASLLNYSAWIAGLDGRFALARELAAESARLSSSDFGESQTLHYIDAHEAAYRGQTERLKVIVDELLRRSDLPLHRANTAMNGALFTWAYCDDEASQRYIAAVEETLTPGLERGFRPLIEAARGRAPDGPDEYLWPVMRAFVQLFRLGNAASDAEAIDAGRRAARAADERGDPMTQFLSHAALFVLDDTARASSAAQLEKLATTVESDEMRAAVAALLAGRPAGILEPFLRTRVRRERAPAAPPRFMVELLSGRVTRDGVAVRLSDKEFELLALLGSAHAPLSRDRIGEALWDHLDPEEWPNNLKVTLSRLRGKLTVRDAVVLSDGRYRLSPLIDVDLRRAETLVRGTVGSALVPGKRDALLGILTAFSAGPSGRYERFAWGQPLQARIDDLVCETGTILANDAIARGRLDEALHFAQTVAAVDRFNEAACETTVRVLLARGDVDAARREVRRYTTALANELGATPSKRLTDLVRSGVHAGQAR